MRYKTFVECPDHCNCLHVGLRCGNCTHLYSPDDTEGYLQDHFELDTIAGIKNNLQNDNGIV